MLLLWQFPRPHSVLKRLLTLLSKFLAGGIAGANPGEYLQQLVGAAKEEVWASRVRSLVVEGAGVGPQRAGWEGNSLPHSDQLPMSTSVLEELYKELLPLPLKALVVPKEEVKELEENSASPEQTLVLIRQVRLLRRLAEEYVGRAQVSEELASSLHSWSFGWPNRHPSEPTRVEDGSASKTIGGEWDVVVILQAILSGAKHVTR